MLEGEETIQIVAFSTDDINCNPNNIINILLEQYTHKVIQKSQHAISFTIVLPNSVRTTKIMMCSLLNLTREYKGVTDVNFYFIFINLQNEQSKESFDSIVSYAENYCELTKKIYVLGIINQENYTKQTINKDDIKKIMDSGKFNYEYIELNLLKKKEVIDSLLNLFNTESKESSIEEGKNNKNDKKAHLCNVF